MLKQKIPLWRHLNGCREPHGTLELFCETFPGFYRKRCNADKMREVAGRVKSWHYIGGDIDLWENEVVTLGVMRARKVFKYVKRKFEEFGKVRVVGIWDMRVVRGRVWVNGVLVVDECDERAGYEGFLIAGGWQSYGSFLSDVGDGFAGKIYTWDIKFKERYDFHGR